MSLIISMLDSVFEKLFVDSLGPGMMLYYSRKKISFSFARCLGILALQDLLNPISGLLDDLQLG